MIKKIFTMLSLFSLSASALARTGELTIINPTFFEVSLSILENDEVVEEVTIDPLDGVSIVNSVFSDEDGTQVRVKVDYKELSKVYDATFKKSAASIIESYTGPQGNRARYLEYLRENLKLSGVRHQGLNKYLASIKDNEVSQSHSNQFLKCWAYNMAVSGGMIAGAKVGTEICSAAAKTKVCSTIAKKVDGTYIKGFIPPKVSSALDSVSQTVSEKTEKLGNKVFNVGCDCSEYLRGKINQVHGTMRGVPGDVYDDWYRAACVQANDQFINDHSLNWFIETKFERASGFMYSSLRDELLGETLEGYLNDRKVHWLEMVIVEEFVEKSFTLQCLDDMLAVKFKDTAKTVKNRVKGSLRNYLQDYVSSSFIKLEDISKTFVEIKQKEHRTLFLTAPESI